MPAVGAAPEESGSSRLAVPSFTSWITAGVSGPRAVGSGRSADVAAGARAAAGAACAEGASGTSRAVANEATASALQRFLSLVKVSPNGHGAITREAPEGR